MMSSNAIDYCSAASTDQPDLPVDAINHSAYAAEKVLSALNHLGG